VAEYQVTPLGVPACVTVPILGGYMVKANGAAKAVKVTDADGFGI
jgi:hypothetical protein